jgi:flagella basal body P-ring formation protein FlgA
VIVAMLVLAAADGTLALKEKAAVSGRYVPLRDLVEAAPAELADVYLGRAPEEGRTRVITAGEIQRELERRGLDAFTVAGEKVEVRAGGAPSTDDTLRPALAFELKRALLDRRPDARPGDVSVQILEWAGAAGPGLDVIEVRPGEEFDGGRMEFKATVADSRGKKSTWGGTARVRRAREVAVAAREIPAGKAVERADLEVRRVEVADEDRGTPDLAALLGARTRARVAKGAAVMAADVRTKPVVRKGDLVRAISPRFEVDARATEDGAPGEEISVEFPTTKNRVRAKVAAAGRVEIEEGGR